MTQEQIAYLQSIGADMNQFNSLGGSSLQSSPTISEELPVITPPNIPQVGTPPGDPPIAGTPPGSPGVATTYGSPDAINLESEIATANENFNNQQGALDIAKSITSFNMGNVSGPSDSAANDVISDASSIQDKRIIQAQNVDKTHQAIDPYNENSDLITNRADMAIANASEAADVSFSGEKQVPPTENKKMDGLKGLFYNKTHDGAAIAEQAAVDASNTSIESGMTQKKKGSEAFGKTLKSTGNPLMAGIVATATTVGGHAANISAKRQQVRNQEQAKFAMERAEMASIYNDPNSVYYRGPKGYLA